jgi:hypothetical protein
MIWARLYYALLKASNKLEIYNFFSEVKDEDVLVIIKEK